jgi:hypothetical protein
VGKQKISVATAAFLVSASLVISVLLEVGGPQRVEGTVFEEDTLPRKYGPPDEDDELPVWLSDYSTHVPLIGIPPALPTDLDSVEHLRKREHEREEAECAAFIEERMRRLSEVEAR